SGWWPTREGAPPPGLPPARLLRPLRRLLRTAPDEAPSLPPRPLRSLPRPRRPRPARAPRRSPRLPRPRWPRPRPPRSTPPRPRPGRAPWPPSRPKPARRTRTRARAPTACTLSSRALPVRDRADVRRGLRASDLRLGPGAQIFELHDPALDFGRPEDERRQRAHLVRSPQLALHRSTAHV